MYPELLASFITAAQNKEKILKNSVLRYVLLSVFAGFFVGLGILLIFTIGGQLGDIPSRKLIMGMTFGIALSLVIMAGSELFTGNNMIMTAASLEKQVSWATTLKIWLFSYIGNLLGAITVSAIYVQTGLAKAGVLDFMHTAAAAKMNGDFTELFFRGVLCNILVCLAVLISFKSKEDTAKLIMIWWCLFAFITTGYEHSIANMTLFSVALFTPHPEAVSLAGAFNNIAASTLGNIVGGAGFLGLGYWYVGHKRNA